MICICHVSDKLVREAAKRDRVPLSWYRGIKRMHNQYRIHELFREYIVAIDPPDGALRAKPEEVSPKGDELRSEAGKAGRE